MASSRKKKMLSPLECEAMRVAEEKRRRQEALRAAQQYALRNVLARRMPLSVMEESASSETVNGDASEPEAPTFDDVRSALKSARQKDSKVSGQNPRFVSALDDASCRRS